MCIILVTCLESLLEYTRNHQQYYSSKEGVQNKIWQIWKNDWNAE